MRILFFIRSFSHIRPYRSILAAFSKRKDEVLIVFDRREKKRTPPEFFDALTRRYPGLRYAFGFRRRGISRKIIRPMRELRSYRRYLLVKRQAEFYRERWVLFLPKSIRFILRVFPKISRALIKSRAFGWLLRLVERVTPPVREITEQIKNARPDAVLVAYRNLPSAASDLEYLKTAKHLRIPTLIPVLGWDTLTTKGLIHIIPDRVLAWNTDQTEELREHHRVPKEIIRVVGAYQFDYWLSFQTPSMTREAFCGRYGLRPEDPIILYLGFSYGAKDTRIPGGHSVAVVAAIRKALDESGDPSLRRVQIIVRPHPRHVEDFKDLAVRDTVVIPRENSYMQNDVELQLFFDTLSVSVAAVAINTTGIIDSVIQGKPGIILNWDAYRTVQQGTHFKRFLESGSVAVTKTPAEFAKIIRNLIDGKDDYRERRERYFETFIRPKGRERTAGEGAVSEIAALVEERKKA